MRCDGACEKHVGRVVVVGVVSESGKDWGEFNYCQQAIQDDTEDGFVVTAREIKEVM